MLEQTIESVREELLQTEGVIAQAAATGIAAADALSHALTAGGGKRIRPAMFLLSAKMSEYAGKGGDELARIAAAIEMIHAASLMHDDVVDGSALRRGKESANSTFGDKLSILAGDFFWTAASRLILDVGKPTLLEAVIDSVKQMTLGQMLELSHNRNTCADEATCLKIIEGKTATLFRLAAQAGAIASNAPQACDDALAQYGLFSGMAFQLLDDVMDYVASGEILGKAPGSDLSAGTPTIPFVHALGKASAEDRALLAASLHGKDGMGLSRALPLIKEYGGIAYTLELSADYAQRAKDALSPFADSPSKSALLAIADFISTPIESPFDIEGTSTRTSSAYDRP
jgi:octaprenyl-diphosphate synthase